jgi:hypothetical protein
MMNEERTSSIRRETEQNKIDLKIATRVNKLMLFD